MTNRATHFIQLLDALARTHGRTVSAFRDLRLAQGLSDMENVVLSAVVGARVAPTASQIGRSLGHPRQVIQRAADSLAVRGLITAVDNPDHKRARLLEPTEAGRQLKAAADIRGLAIADSLTIGLDADLIARTVAGLNQIRAAIEANMRAREDEEQAA